MFNRFQRLIGVQDEDSCGKSETGETPQEQRDEEAHRPPAESEVLHGNQQRRLTENIKGNGGRDEWKKSPSATKRDFNCY
jgi:hypothetical protein